MTWTTPKTWVASGVPTAAEFNTHVRDNMLHLKTPFDADGKLVALASGYVASLDGTNLTGLIKLAADSSPLAKNDFNAGSGTRLVLPVGADKYGGTSGNKTAGSLWVEGDYLHHVSTGQIEYRYFGTLVGTPAGAVVGSVWLDTDNLIHYIDSSGEERYVRTTQAGHADAGANAGSVWVETYCHWAYGGGQEAVGHADVTHSDHTDYADIDVPHVDHDDHTDHDDHDDAGGGHTDHTDHVDGVDHDDWGGHEDHYDYVHVNHDDHGDHNDYIDWGGYSDYDDHVDHDDHDDAGGYSDHTDHTDGSTHGDVVADSRPVTA